MKKTLLSLLLIGATIGSYAQKKEKYTPRERHEVRLGLGAFPTNYSYDNYHDFITDDHGIYNSHLMNETFSLRKIHSPALNVAYSYRFSRLFALEMALSYNTINRNFYDLYSDKKVFKERQHTYIIMPVARFHWLTRECFSLYSSLGMGLMLTDFRNPCGLQGVKDTEYELSVQFALLGITYGKKLFVFGEVGGSNIGCLQAGLGYRF